MLNYREITKIIISKNKMRDYDFCHSPAQEFTIQRM